MTRTVLTRAAVAAICAAVSLLRGAPDVRADSPDPAAGPRLRIAFDDVTLANGLRLITIEDRRAPIVTLAMMVDVGSANEQPGRTGFAHLFEHLMFQGSANVDAGQHSILIANYGGQSNAMTSTDWTFYFDNVPTNQVDLTLFLNADRMRSLAISAESFAREKEVVKEERRMRVDNQPYRRSAFALNELMYDSFAYGHEGIGSMADLDASSLDDIRRFFDTYYTAGNTVLVLIGDIDTATARQKVVKYFGALLPRPAPPAADRTEPRQTTPRRQTVVDVLAPAPRVSLAFKTVPGNHPDYFALRVLLAVLQSGHSSRLYEPLVNQGLATSISGSLDETRGAGGFYLTADLQPGVDSGSAERAIYGEIERLQDRKIEDWELQKARSLIGAEILGDLHRGLIRALYIASSTVDFDDPQRINTYLDRIGAVTQEDVQRVAREHLRVGNRTVVVTMPKTAAEGSP